MFQAKMQKNLGESMRFYLLIVMFFIIFSKKHFLSYIFAFLNKYPLNMKKIISALALSVMFAAGSFSGLTAQVKQKQITDGERTVFGKTYTAEELQKTNGMIRCATTEYEQYLQQMNPNRATDAEFEAWLAPLIEQAKNNKSFANGVITIPVVVHVIHNGQNLGVAPNITDNQVISQITVMNQDFAKMAGTPGWNNNPIGANTMIQFALAKVDPNGNPTNGINRVNLCQPSWSTSDINSIVKPQTIWDPTQYMNMWSVNFSSSSLLGYAQFPSTNNPADLAGFGGGANTDGVVSAFRFFGSSTFNDGTFILSAPYDKGRTMTHEVGHYLGLRHIWGDANCGNDFVADTPVHQTSNGGCPSHPKPNSCGTADEMFENYMDYTTDGCMNIFTQGQSVRMNTVMNNAVRRSTLITSTKNLPIALFPVDAEIKVERSCSITKFTNCTQTAPNSPLNFTIYNRGTSMLTSATISYTIGGGAPQTYNWSGSLAQDKFATFTVPVAAGTTSGTVSASIVSANGTTDQRATNNTATGNYTAGGSTAPNYQYSSVVFRLQQDYWGSETTWNLKNQAGATMYSGGPYSDTPQSSPLPPVITQTWNLTPGCYIFTINDDWDDGICCGGGNGWFDIKSPDGSVIIYSGGTFTDIDQVAFKVMTLSTTEVNDDQFDIYPIPVGEILNITNVSDKAQYTIFNAAGQIVSKGNIKDNKISVSELTTGNYVITIQENEFKASSKFIKK